MNDNIIREAVQEWIISNQIEVLNIAGSRESSELGIGEWTYDFLCEVLKPFGAHPMTITLKHAALPIGQWDVAVKNWRSDKVLSNDELAWIDAWNDHDRASGARHDDQRSRDRVKFLELAMVIH